MQARVATTVTKVPLSGAEWGPPLQAPHCQPNKPELDHFMREEKALPTACKGCVRLRSIQGKCQRGVWIEHSSLPHCTRPALIPDSKRVRRLGKLKFWVCLIVCVRVPHH